MMTLLRRFCLVLLICAAFSGVYAQSPDFPLVMEVDGDFYAWDGTSDSVTQLTDSGYNYYPRLSPDGSKLVYFTFPQITTDAIAAQSCCSVGFPTDHYILDLTTGDSLQVSAQPPEATIPAMNEEESATIRSYAEWSPDGTKIAWIENDLSFMNPGNRRLVVYSLAADASRVIADIPRQTGQQHYMMSFNWTEIGIVVHNRPSLPGVLFYDEFLVYSDDGTLKATLVVELPDRLYVIKFAPLTYEGKDYVAIEYNDNSWVLIDVATGEHTPAPNVPEMVSGLAPETSVGMRPVDKNPGNRGVDTYTAEIVSASGEVLDVTESIGYSPFITTIVSPDGQGLLMDLYAEEGGYDSTEHLYLWRDGELIEVPIVRENQEVANMTWGPQRWRMRG